MKAAEKKIREAAMQSRFRYEHAMVEARHARDTALAAAWHHYNVVAAGAYATYRKDADPLETLINKALKS